MANIFDIAAIHDALAEKGQAGGESLTQFDDAFVGVGRYEGDSGWRRNPNGDELLYLIDGTVEIERLYDDGTSALETLESDQLVIVERNQWNRLECDGFATVLYISPSEDGAERQDGHPDGEDDDDFDGEGDDGEGDDNDSEGDDDDEREQN
jgi:hypothetical protein